MVGPHLDDGDFRARGDGQQRERHADVVVEIALRGRDTVFLRQHGGDEVLGGGLAVGAGQAEHRQFSATHVRPVPDGEIAQRGERIGYADEAVDQRAGVADLGVIVDDRPGSTGLQRLEGVVVAVEILSPQGEEDLSAADGPAVGGDPIAAGAVFGVQFFHNPFISCRCCRSRPLRVRTPPVRRSVPIR